MNLPKVFTFLAPTLALLTTVPTASATVRYVDADAPPGGDGSDWDQAFNHLQDALLVATAGDDIRVAEGTYRPDERSDWPPDGSGDRYATFQFIIGVAMYGGYAGFGQPDPDQRDITGHETILSGDLAENDVGDLLDPSRDENSYHVMYAQHTERSAVVDGFTIARGHARGAPPGEYAHTRGGGIYVYAYDSPPPGPTISHCLFTANFARDGGALFFHGDSLSLSYCTFTGNQGGSGGGVNIISDTAIVDHCTFHANIAYEGAGVHCTGALTLIQCTFSENYGGNGPAIYNGDELSFSTTVLIDCLFTGNTAVGAGGAIFYYSIYPPSSLVRCTFTGNTAGGSGGAIYSDWASYMTMRDCLFQGNQAGLDGGAIKSIVGGDGGSVSLTNVVFENNTAMRSGGAMFLLGSEPYHTLTNCIFHANSAQVTGGALHLLWAETYMTNCTLAANSAPVGRALFSEVPTYSRIIALTNVILWDGDSEIVHDENSLVTVNYSDVLGGWPGQGNIDRDPLLKSDGVHLSRGSPCTNAGDPAFVAEPGATDIDDQPRVLGGRVDMGADETVMLQFLPAAVDR